MATVRTRKYKSGKKVYFVDFDLNIRKSLVWLNNGLLIRRFGVSR
ncbi:hypothetical protein ACFL4T_09205 [candidate division KSB1 bacterium]